MLFGQRQGAIIHFKLDELWLARVQDVIFIFLVLTIFIFLGPSVGKHDTLGINSIILGIQGHICFLVMVSKENCFYNCNPLSRKRQFICLAAACLENNCPCQVFEVTTFSKVPLHTHLLLLHLESAGILQECISKVIFVKKEFVVQ